MTTVSSKKFKRRDRIVDFVGEWHNQHGSVIHVEEADGDLIKGTFKSGVGSVDPEKDYPLIGFISDDLICFTVKFGPHQCVTPWTGQHTVVDDAEKIETMWHLARPIPDRAEEKSLWAGIWTGADTYIRSTGKKERKLDRIDRPPFHPSYPFRISLK